MQMAPLRVMLFVVGMSSMFAATARATLTTLDDFESGTAPAPWRFGNGPEFPGATGALTVVTGRGGHVAHLAYDFGCTGTTATCDPRYVQAALTLTTPVAAGAVALQVRTSAALVRVRVVDSTGQTLQYAPIAFPLEADTLLAWTRVVVPLGAADSHWGGSNDGTVHGTITSIAVLAEGTAPRGTGYLDLDDVVVATTADELADRSFTFVPSTASFALIDSAAAQLAPRLGVNIHFTSDNRALDAAQSAGFTWIRMDLGWAWVETTKGQYDFSAFDALVSEAEARGMRTLLILDFGNPLYTDGPMIPPRTPDAISAFGAYAEAAARHFAGRDTIFEVWNEPDIVGFWGPAVNQTEYEALLREGLRRVHAGNGSAFVLTGGLSSPYPATYAWLDTMFGDGSATGANGVGMHLYVWSAPETRWQDVLRLRDLISTGLGGKPLYCTEWGYDSTRYSTVSDGHDLNGRLRQAVMASRELLTSWRAGLPLVIYYDIRDDGDDAAEPEHNFGLLARDYSDKPAMIAVRRLSAAAAGRRLTGIASGAPPGIHVLRLEGSPDVLIAWNEVAGSPATMQLPLAEVDGATTMGGTAITWANQNGYVSLVLDEASGPVYVTLRTGTGDGGTGYGGVADGGVGDGGAGDAGSSDRMTGLDALGRDGKGSGGSSGCSCELGSGTGPGPRGALLLALLTLTAVCGRRRPRASTRASGTGLRSRYAAFSEHIVRR